MHQTGEKQLLWSANKQAAATVETDQLNSMSLSTL